MTGVAGEVADGIIPHGFTTERYLREVTLPAVMPGLARSGRDRSAFQVTHLALTATGRTREELAAAAKAVRDQIAFYGSTPSYRPVLESHGWGELATELNELSRSDRPDRWSAMGDLIDDDRQMWHQIRADLVAMGRRGPWAAGWALPAELGDLVVVRSREADQPLRQGEDPL